MSERIVGGLDGCRAGWVLATVPVDGPVAGALNLTVVASLESIVVDLESGRMAAAAIDIPIGLPPADLRWCDRAARRRLGSRRSSVFPAPVRPVLAATSYAEACALSRRACGRAISQQLFHILPKIRAVDRLQSPELQAQLFEMHPELSFAVLAGGPMASNKRTVEGRAQRAAALAATFGDLSRLVDAPPAGARADDVLDAIVGAWTARRYVARTHLRLGGELDERGLRMEIVA